MINCTLVEPCPLWTESCCGSSGHSRLQRFYSQLMSEASWNNSADNERVKYHIYGRSNTHNVCLIWKRLVQSVTSLSTLSHVCTHIIEITNNVDHAVRFLLGNSLASEFYMPTFRNTLFVPPQWTPQQGTVYNVKKEGGGHLPFQDTDIYRKTDGSLGHKVYRTPTHTSLCLH